MVNFRHLQRRTVVITVVVSMLWLILAVHPAAAVPRGDMARSVSVNDTASMHLVSKSGSVLAERGTATGTLPGAVNARFVLRVTEATGSVTIAARGGSLTLKVDGFAQSAGTLVRLNGTMMVKRGTGRYAHARGTASFSATVNRRSWSIKVRVRGHLSY